jgi:hypothetical protein
MEVMEVMYAVQGTVEPLGIPIVGASHQALCPPERI